MTQVVAVPRRAPVRSRAPHRGRATRPAARPPVRTTTAVATRVAARSNIGRVGAFLALAVVFVLVSAVLFHVVLAQGQLELDRLETRIAVERREYEQRRLSTATLAAPPRIIDEAQRLGLVLPEEPPEYLEVLDAPVPETGTGTTSTTFDDWEEVKPHLGDSGP